MSADNPEVEISKEEPQPPGQLPWRWLQNGRALQRKFHAWWNAPLKKTSLPSSIPDIDKEKLQEMLKEQAQQARTMFFTYISAYAFLMVTLFSVTDKAILLNNTLIKLPIIGSDIPLNILFIVAPPLLIVTYNNFQIHYHRYVRTAFHPSLTNDERQLLFPFALFQGMFQHTQDGVGFIESAFAKGATFCLLTLALFCYLIYGGKFQHEGLDYWLLFCLMLGVLFEHFWLQETFLAFSRNIGWIRGKVTLKILGIAAMMWGLWHLIPYTIYVDPLRAFPKIDDLDWLLLGLALLLWQEGEKLTQLYGQAQKHIKLPGWLIALLLVLGSIALLALDFQNWTNDQQKLNKYEQSQTFIELQAEWHDFKTEWRQLTKWQTIKKNKKVCRAATKPMLRHVFKALYEQRFSKGIEAINGFLFLKLDNQVLSTKPSGLNDIRDGLFPENAEKQQKDTVVDKNQKNAEPENKAATLNWASWLPLPGKSLNRIHLKQAMLPWANFDGAHLMEAQLSYAELQYSHFRNAHMEEAQLFFANLEKADLNNAHLENAYLGSAHLEEAVLRDAYLEKANLSGAYLEEADLSSAYLEEANLDAYLERANLTDAYLEKANLTDAYLEKANLSSAHLKKAILRDAHLENADLSDTRLENAVLSRADLRGSYFSYKGVNEKTGEWIPDYDYGGEKELCAAQTLEGAKVDYLLWKRLMKPTACPNKARTMDVYPKSLLKQQVNRRVRKKAKR